MIILKGRKIIRSNKLTKNHYSINLIKRNLSVEESRKKFCGESWGGG